MTPATGARAARLGIIALLVSGCLWTGEDAAPCLPAPMTIGTWGPHAAGTSIDLSADPFPCDGSYGSGHTYRATLVVTPPDRTGARFDLGSFPVARDGSFATSLRLPPDAPAGRAVLNLRGSTYDRCDDGNSACPGYESPGFAVTG